MQRLLTGTHLMAELTVNRKTLALLAACGVLTPTPVGTALVYDPDEVERLRSARAHPVSEGAPPAWVVRLSKPAMGSDGVHPLGWLEERDEDGKPIPSTPRNVEAARMYWRIVKPEEAVGDALVAVVGPLVVGVWQIDEESTFHEDVNRSEFKVREATEEQRLAYLGERTDGRWLALRPGPTVLRWPISRESNNVVVQDASGVGSESKLKEN